MNTVITQQHQYKGQAQVAAKPMVPAIGGKFEIRFYDPSGPLQTHCTRCT